MFVKWFALCYQTIVCPVCDVDVLWPNGWMDQDDTWQGGRPLPWPHCVRWGASSPPQKALVCCGQTAGWIKLPLGREIGLSPGDTVRWGPSSPQKGAQQPRHFFGPCIVDKGLDGSMPLSTEVGLGLGHIVLDGDPAPLWKGAQQPPPHFSAHVYCGQTAGWIKMPLGREVSLGPGHIVLEQSPFSATAEHSCTAHGRKFDRPTDRRTTLLGQ